METMVLILCLILTLIVMAVCVAATIVVLRWMASRASSQESSLEVSLQTQSLQFEATLTSVLETMLTMTKQQTESTVRTLLESSSKAASGTDSALAAAMGLIADQSRMLGTKDAIAYQMVAGADSISAEGPGVPYTTGDELEAFRLVAAQAKLDELIAQGEVDGEAYRAAEAAGSYGAGIPGF